MPDQRPGCDRIWTWFWATGEDVRDEIHDVIDVDATALIDVAADVLRKE